MDGRGPFHNNRGMRFVLIEGGDISTHVDRTEALVDDAIALARRGAFVDMDTVEEDVVERLPYYRLFAVLQTYQKETTT